MKETLTPSCSLQAALKAFIKTRVWILLLVGILLASFKETYGQTSAEIIYLTGPDSDNTVLWDFMVSEGRKAGIWDKIPVPSNWELQGFGEYNYGHDHSNKDRVLHKEVGNYRHRFQVPAGWDDKVVQLVFAGVMTDTKVKINGEVIGAVHQGGFYEFSYDVTEFLKRGEENVLEVQVEKHSSNASVNRAEREADFWIFGGIFRPVYLRVLPKTHFLRVAVNPKASGEFNAFLELNRAVDDGVVQVDLYDPNSGKLISTFKEEFTGETVSLHHQIEGVISWNPESPQLYKAEFTLSERGNPLFSQTETIGFRTVELRRQDGIYVNDTRVVFKGVNRHSFYPTTGRALSRSNHLEDILLIKEMNMNAVRMSHYPPDKEFLALCDSIGLFVLDEVTGWQAGYDTIVGPKLIAETVLRDENHPSVIIWDHGNEGGWDFANEKWFHHHDIQKRPVIYPWLQRNGVDTFHYPIYNAGTNRLSNGQDIFMPTELLHGLYDGGLGAGLEDFWNDYMNHPMAAGGFLWVFADEAVVRTDLDGILDADGNHAPDGIVGPYREKEGSFYTIKEIWSPVKLDTRRSDLLRGNVLVKNEYLYTSLQGKHIKWELIKWNGLDSEEVIDSGQTPLPDLLPGESKRIALELGEKISESHVIKLYALDEANKIIDQWAVPMVNPAAFANQTLPHDTKAGIGGKISMSREDDGVRVTNGDIEYGFDANGNLKSVKKSGKSLSLHQGDLIGSESKPKELIVNQSDDGEVTLKQTFDEFPHGLTWTVMTNGLLKLETAYPQRLAAGTQVGIGFSYPEEEVKGVKWIGKGPYRVWANRLRGPKLGLWSKDYNNTVTGVSSNGKLEYPEFKGFHADLYGLELMTEEGNFQVYTETSGLFFKLFNPEQGGVLTPGVTVDYGTADISFLYTIPAIGTKFHKAEVMGPQSRPKNGVGHTGDQGYPIVLWFSF